MKQRGFAKCQQKENDITITGTKKVYQTNHIA